ncbi:MAG: hypothetical protein R3C16_05505 [Hyphomonadaceae bacterium]
MRVLVVEDDLDMAESLRTSLSADEHDVDVANDGEAGIRWRSMAATT